MDVVGCLKCLRNVIYKWTYQSFFFVLSKRWKKIKIFSKQSKINRLEKSRGIKKPWLLQHPIELQHILLLKLCGNLAGFSVETKQENLYLIRVVCAPISLCITLISLTQIENPNKQKTLPGIWQNITLVMATIGMYGNYPFTSYFWPVIWSSLGNSR